MRNIKFCTLIFLLAAFFFPATLLYAKAIHLFLAGDTRNGRIGESVGIDLKNVEDTFTYIAKMAKVPLHIKKITSLDNSLTLGHLDAHLREAQVSPDDVIIFYYSGHGSRTRKTHLVFPYLEFSNANIVSETVIKKLFSKKGALSLVLFDCCNSYAYKSSAADNTCLFRLDPIDDPQIAINCEKLFFQRRGALVACASQMGEYATGLPFLERDGKIAAGGYFTNAFLNILFKKLRTSRPHWASILKNTKKICRKGSRELHKKYNWAGSPHTPLYACLLYPRNHKECNYMRRLLKHYRAQK